MRSIAMVNRSWWVVPLIAALLPPCVSAQPVRSIAVGETRTDSLTARDPVLRSRRSPYQVWSLGGKAGQRIVIDLMSADFDAYLVLRDADGRKMGSDDDSGERTNARLHAVLPRDGRYRLIATAIGDSARGRYTLAVSGWETPAAPPSGRSAIIGVGETKDGILEPGDELSADGPYQDRWTVDAPAGARFTVGMRSSDLDSYLVVLGPDGAVVGSDDDGGGGKDAEVALRAGAGGSYTILATSYGDEPAVGAYRLSVQEDAGEFAEPGAAASVAMGESREGRLEAGDVRGARGFEDRWTFEGRAGQGVRLDATSGAFDAYLVLLRNGTVVDSNDDGGEGRNARIIAVLPETGTYTAVISSFGGEGSGGRYAIQLTALAGAPPAPASTGHLAVGDRVVGRLEPGDLTREDAGYQDFWEFEGRGGEDVVAELRSVAFDTYLELYRPDGTLLTQDDDGLGDGTNSLITAHLSRAGRYRLVVRSYSQKERAGLYELALLSTGPVAPPGAATEIRAGATVVGRLEPGDSTVGDSTFADVYLFRPQTSGEAVIDLRSGDFDAYLILQDASGRVLVADDDGGSGTDARITYAVTAGRTYRILANSYGGSHDTGTYRLSVRLGAGSGARR
jgi:hypothetical protein